MREAFLKRLRAWVLLATFLCPLGSSQLLAGHFGLIDAACGDVGIVESGGLRVDVALSGPLQHCPICHFLRAVSGAAVATIARVAVPEWKAVRVAVATQAAPASDISTRLSRGPPTGTRPSVCVL